MMEDNIIKISEDTYMIVDKSIVNNGKFNWKDSVGTHLIGKYQGIEFDFKIIDYISSGHGGAHKIKISYKGKEKEIGISKIKIFGGFKIILGIINPDFKYEIGQVIKDNKRNLIITNKKHSNGRKLYKYKCLKCGYDCGKCYDLKLETYKEEYWIDEKSLNYGNGCNCCKKTTGFVVKGINDIATTNPKLIPYFVNEEDIYTHTCSSNKKALCKCPNCGFEKEIIINNLQKHGLGCRVCSDGIKFPNKFMYYILKELNMYFETEKRFDWCTYYNPYKNKDSFGIYDFYIPSKQLIIEMDGGWHKTDNNISGQTLEESRFIDNTKDNLANKHNLKVIRIDCNYENYNNGEYVKEKILQSELNVIFKNLSFIDFEKCSKQCQKTLVKEVCDYWNNNKNVSTEEIGKYYNLCSATIVNYLKIGNNLGWCKYDSKEEMRKNGKNSHHNKKQVEVFKDGESKGIFKSSADLERKSKELFGVEFKRPQISSVCNGKIKSYKGFIFKFKLNEGVDFNEYN